MSISDKIDWTTIEVYTNPSDVFDSTLGTVGNLCVFKLGKIVWLQGLSFNAHTTVQAGTVVATLKSKFRPRQSNTRTPVMASTGHYINSITRTSGQMVEYENLTNGITYYSSTTWITN